MDVRQWLENTADRAPPDQEVEVCLPGFIQPQSEPEQLTRKYRQKRKRASSDSSIIEARHSHRKRTKAAKRAHSSDEAESAGPAVARSRSSQSSQRSSSIARQAPRKSYDKRARHKTKADRYEIKSKKPRKEREPREEERSRPTRRKSHRSGDGRRTTGLVQSFQLKNGPKNSRLTLKPEATAGLFKHGRTSAQVTGRGGGLPDLVFNEMRFLQKPKDHQDELVRGGDAHHAAKKDRKTQREEEISAYFAAQKVDQRQAPVDDRRSNVAGIAPPQAHQMRSRPSEPGKRITELPVDLPEKAFLGFGSKGAQVDSGPPHDRSNSYYTWSDSVPPQKAPRQSHFRSAAAGEGHERPPRAPERRQPTSAEHDPAEEVENADTAVDIGRSSWHQTRRTRGPTLVEVYQPPIMSTENEHRRQRSVTKTTLQSLPRQASRGPLDLPSEHSDGAIRRQRSVSYHTSDILDVRGAHRDPAQTRHRRQEAHQVNDSHMHEKENLDPRSSSPTGKLLRQAQEALERPVQHSTPVVSTRRHTVQDYVYATDSLARFEDDGGQVAATEASKNRTPRGPDLHNTLPERRLQSAAGLRTERTSITSRHTSVQRQSIRPRNDHRETMPQPVEYDAEDEMLDHGPDATLFRFDDHFTFANARDAEELVHGKRSDRASGIYQAQAEQFGHMPSDAQQYQASASDVSAARMPTTTSPVRGLSIEQDLQSEQPVVGVDHTSLGTLDELAGFWKPHRLY